MGCVPRIDLAERYFRKGWHRRNAGRDAMRRCRLLAAGLRPDVVSLEALPETCLLAPGNGQAATGLGDPFDAGETGEEVVRWLREQGWSEVRARAFVWYAVRGDWSEVAWLLRHRLRYRATEAQLRQWGTRHFEPIKPRLRRWLEQTGW